MWWHDIKEINAQIFGLNQRLFNLETKIDAVLQKQEDGDDFVHLSDRLGDMDDTINALKGDLPRFEKLINPENTVATYEKHIKKLEEMMLEFKGCVSQARSCVAEKKEQQKDLEELKKTTKIAQDIYEAMRNFIDAGNGIERQKFFKLDAIYNKLCENEEQPKKKRTSRKKSTSLEF